MKVKGIKRGKFIELLEDIAIEDGVEVSVEFVDTVSDKTEQWEKLQEVIGEWKDDQEITDIFAQIDQERHADIGRPVNFDDHF
ncbi:hypothetical protein FRE64_17065 (plasmid) [Euhalothece natronophila Z-M001]|uniref:Uncharacterized protein n=1 Tax=Euhalothece natronophila Z-M001 TaxID=522448 RepID=A0A5B8NRT4_9CHRO|nr:hypothetical protein [Euhalothece natronophila]QDZ41677.1 hypothetical protein FRE64_17065 [Euhalothece natronophila Z-M001]